MDKEIFDYERELESKGVLTKDEIADLVAKAQQGSMEALSKLFEYHLYYAYRFAMKQPLEKELTRMEYIHAANEALEVAITSLSYKNVVEFYDCIDRQFKETIALLLSYL